MEPSRDKLAGLARMLADTASAELDCDAVLDRLAALLERGLEAAEGDPELARVRQHLRVCPECLEEFELLQRLNEAPDAESSDEG